jgi:hypothetical protein
MKILTIPECAEPKDTGRLEILEKMASSILKRIQDIEERIKALESPQTDAPKSKPEIQNAVPAAPPTSEAVVRLDADAVKKNLLDKMWKYLNDEAAA